MNARVLLCFALINCMAVHAKAALLPDASTAYLAMWRPGQQIQAWKVTTRSAQQPVTVNIQQLNTPLGSVWKLFVYSYLIENNLPSADYVCQGRHPDEKYCCSKGGRIGREAALIQSCGLYFDPARLNISSSQWQQFWQRQRAPAWLTRLDYLNEKQTLPVKALLEGLAVVPAPSRQQAETTLLNLWLKEANQSTLAALGTQIRAKTYTMPYPGKPQERLGGGAGWLTDGRPVWFSARGNSMQALSHTAKALKPLLQIDQVSDAASSCVEIDYFAFSRNAIRRIVQPRTGRVFTSGQLPKGEYTVSFIRGQPVSIVSDHDLFVQPLEGQRYRLTGRLSMTEYIARVIDREAAAQPEQAAKALAVAIRTYARQEASSSQQCLRLEDSTRMQRVAARPSSQAARAIAAQTEHLIMTGTQARYQLHTQQADQLSWQTAVKQANQGLVFPQILARAYPRSALAITDSTWQPVCQRVPNADQWLSRQQSKWLKTLRAQPGFVALAQLPSICYLSRGLPYADVAANRIFIRQFKTRNDQITMIHEYLHLVFAHHPSGADERFIEQLAGRLLSEINA